MQIIPSIDIIDGQCVRLLRGEFLNKTTYPVSPSEIVQRYVRSGAKALHIVDLDGAKSGHITNWETLGEMLAFREAEIQVGGGIRSDSEIERLLDLGAARVVVGSAAVESPELVKQWVERFGAAKFCIALDLDDGFLAYEGWVKKTGLKLADAIAEMNRNGITRFLSTDIRKDGTLEGPNFEMYSSLVKMYPGQQWYASGGVRSLADVRTLKTIGVSGVIIGKALFEGTLRLEDLLEVAC